MSLTSVVEPAASSVRHLAGGLGQQQALFGGGREQAPATPLPDQRVVIELGVVAQERQPEAILTARLAMASASIAAVPRQDRLDLVDEVDELHVVAIADLDIERLAAAIVLDGQLGLAGPKRPDVAP